MRVSNRPKGESRSWARTRLPHIEPYILFVIIRSDQARCAHSSPPPYAPTSAPLCACLAHRAISSGAQLTRTPSPARSSPYADPTTHAQSWLFARRAVSVNMLKTRRRRAGLGPHPLAPRQRHVTRKRRWTNGKTEMPACVFIPSLFCVLGVCCELSAGTPRRSSTSHIRVRICEGGGGAQTFRSLY